MIPIIIPLILAEEAKDRVRRHPRKSRIGGFLEERGEGAEDSEGSVDVDVDGLVDGFRGEVDGFVPDAEDAGLGEDDVDVGNVVLCLEFLDDVVGVGGGGVLKLHDDEAGARGFGEGVNVVDAGMGGVTDAGDDDGVGAGEPFFGNAEADAWEQVSLRACY